MKVAILSESPADEASLRILIEAVLRRPIERAEVFSLRSRGWPSVRDILPSVLKHLHYRTDAEGLVVVADSDDDPRHQAQHEEAGKADPDCRICQLTQQVAVCRSCLRALPGRKDVRVAIGMAVPAIEAWWLCGQDPHIVEAAWSRTSDAGMPPFTRIELKHRLYGTDRPSLQMETVKMCEAAKRLATDMERLERCFPIGFGFLARELRRW